MSEDVVEIRGKKVALKFLADERLTSGGFVLRRGRIEINCTFQALLSSQREAIEIELAALLFGA